MGALYCEERPDYQDSHAIAARQCRGRAAARVSGRVRAVAWPVIRYRPSGTGVGMCVGVGGRVAGGAGVALGGEAAPCRKSR